MYDVSFFFSNFFDFLDLTFDFFFLLSKWRLQVFFGQFSSVQFARR
ncbi:hypothetical protein RchiOBHm_Chr2g0157921 [Rosa chinensis]|uniref:Uncharacterized protein n=1 Tax=Rosa chinensis TaxID=74649 RepID=A0A2P6S1U5_ROSCH|nr:hypothetical protein RchiOBHm_Chr2g0157921 [Rosa chinensis]